MKKISFWMLFGAACFLSACGPARLEQKKRHFLHKGNLSFNEKMYQDAIRYYREALQIDSSFAQAYNNLGVVYYKTGKHDQAIQAYNNCLQIESGYVDAYFNRSNAYYEIGEYRRSLIDLQRISKSFDPESLFFAKGLSYFALQLYDSARFAFEKVIETDTANFEAYINLANASFYLDDLQEAENLILLSLEMERSAEAYNLLGMIAAKRQDFQKALEYYDQGLKIESNNAFILNNRGYLHTQLGNLDLALQDINESIVINPDNAWAYLYKGIYYFTSNDLENAMRLLDQSIDIEPSIGLSYLYLGKVFYESGKMLEACEMFEKAVELGEKTARALKTKYCA